MFPFQPDQQNLIDYIQQQWECCGIDSPADWDANRYFNCTSSILGSREACGVPFSCCKTNSNDLIANKQCGYDVRKEGFVSLFFFLIFIHVAFTLLFRMLILNPLQTFSHLQSPPTRHDVYPIQLFFFH